MIPKILTLPRLMKCFWLVQTYSDFLYYLLLFNYLLSQKNNFTTEESESSGDEKKQEILSNFKEDSTVMRNFVQKGQKPSRNEIPIKR